MIEEKLQHFANIVPGRVNQFTLENGTEITKIVPGVSSTELLYCELHLLKDDIDSFIEFSDVLNKLK